MSRAAVTVAVYDTDAATWKALSQAFEPQSGDTATWVRVTDAETGVAVTFFKSHDDEPWEEPMMSTYADEQTDHPTRTYFTARFDVTNLTVEERGNLALAVSVQAEHNKGAFEDGGYAGVDVETSWDEVEA